uniref:Ionotropic glutamate receptor C-terminal domain-containing protein n=1 Tax=Leptocylindrus danicus TaxID=163516 RepID=A0A7S2PLY1_9STRA|mmetsp:Transcript_5009/g.7351  ORF Transcript_5009/g.7351 Transcript_5009/m.7351 type:complete len:800 (+) Transcript_5009:127-2526(+)|eukprot:CAMPEP_0116011982 /NCGR_PEP_ID=MMETSP0321-20121206/4868_1 /TAXON_ID=163516 /ORGANISM="Leptocylindrus danicus var. danicus, Strain B650" /LENGTH=799 /DNA_ID=CAMNT_0003481271 /DNA_START=118 /DNA_END=2517 /DNA_ORIENTATION=-
MLIKHLVLFIVAVKLRRVPATAGGSHSACPCVDPWINSTDEGASEYAGTYCGNWTENEDKYYREWCFIDEYNCDLPIDDEVSYLNITDDDSENGTGIFYQSTETCGNFEEYRADQLRFQVENKTVRIAYPVDFSDEEKFELEDQLTLNNRLYLDNNAPNGVNGAIVETVEKILDDRDIEYEIVPLAWNAIEKYPNNTFTACMYMVHMDLADMCVGPFWYTAERIALSPVTVELGKDDLVLFVDSREKSYSFAKRLETPFKPFTLGAWFGIILTTFYSVALLYFMNEITSGENVTGQSSSRRFMKRLTQISYGSSMTFTSGDPTVQKSVPEEPNVPQMFAVAGYALFGLITLTAYTASSAALLVLRSSQVASYASIHDVFYEGKSVCTFNNLKSTLELEGENSLKTYSDLIIGKDTMNDIHAALEMGECSGAVVHNLLFISEQYKGKLCNVMRAGPPLRSVGYGLPVSLELQQFMSYELTKAVLSGDYQENLAYHEIFAFPGIDSYPEGKCNPSPPSKAGTRETERLLKSKGASVGDGSAAAASAAVITEDNNEDFEPLNIQDMTAPIFISCFASTVAFLLFIWREYSDRYVQLVTQAFRNLQRDESERTKNDVDLKARLLKTSAYDLIAALRQIPGVNEEDFNLAMELLPDTSGLAALMFEKQCSQMNKDLIYLRGLTILQLNNIIFNADKSSSEKEGQDSYVDVPSEGEIRKATNDVDNPKEKMISLILSSSHLRASLYGSALTFEVNGDENCHTAPQRSSLLTGYDDFVMKRSSTLASRVPKPFKTASIVNLQTDGS